MIKGNKGDVQVIGGNVELKSDYVLAVSNEKVADIVRVGASKKGDFAMVFDEYMDRMIELLTSNRRVRMFFGLVKMSSYNEVISLTDKIVLMRLRKLGTYKSNAEMKEVIYDLIDDGLLFPVMHKEVEGIVGVIVNPLFVWKGQLKDRNLYLERMKMFLADQELKKKR